MRVCWRYARLGGKGEFRDYVSDFIAGALAFIFSWHLPRLRFLDLITRGALHSLSRLDVLLLGVVALLGCLDRCQNNGLSFWLGENFIHHLQFEALLVLLLLWVVWRRVLAGSVLTVLSHVHIGAHSLRNLAKLRIVVLILNRRFVAFHLKVWVLVWCSSLHVWTPERF